METAAFIVQNLIEGDDIDFEMPKHKSEVRILPTDNPQEFDVTLLTGFDPVYIGAIGIKGKLWRPMRVAPGIGRQLRSKLHFVGYTKEEVALAMVEVMRPIWEPKIKHHLNAAAVAESLLDPKDFALSTNVNVQNLKDLRRYPDSQVFLCNDPSVMEHYGFTEPFRCSNVYWKDGGVVSVEFSLQNSGYALPLNKTDFVPVKSLTPVLESSEAEDIEKEAAKAETPASKEQAEAGNYKKGHVNVQGLEIAIENAKGSTRSGTGKDGKKWSVTMPAHYGYMTKCAGETIGKTRDGDHVDCYIGEKPDSIMVFVVNQNNESGKFDEIKAMVGFKTKDEAVDTYKRGFSGGLGEKLFGSVVSVSMDEFKRWLLSEHIKKPFEKLSERIVDGLLA